MYTTIKNSRGGALFTDNTVAENVGWRAIFFAAKQGQVQIVDGHTEAFQCVKPHTEGPLCLLDSVTSVKVSAL